MKYFKKANIKNLIFPFLVILFLVVNFANKDQLIKLFTSEQIVEKTFAEVAVVQNEVKKKKNNSMNWSDANESDSINRGDSVSTGSLSSALVKFKDGQSMTLDQNTLIVFDENGEEAEFVSGNIKLNVGGSLKIKMDNETLTFSGKKAGVQLYKDAKQNKKKIVLLEGDTKVSSKKSIVKLEKNKVIESKQVTTRPEVFAKENPYATRVQYTEFATEQEVASKIAEPFYTDEQPTETQKPIAEESEVIEEQATKSEPQIPTVSYYKLYDYYSKKPDTQFDFILNTHFTEKPNSEFQKFNNSTLTFKKTARLQNQLAPVSLQINDSQSALGYLAEVSNSANFPNEMTRYFWTSAKIQYTFTSPGIYFLRYRKVLNDQILTDYSPAAKITILPDTKLSLAIANKEVVKKYLAEKKAKEVAQYSLTKREPAAIDPAESVLTITPEVSFKNLKYSESFIDINASQGYLASNKQIENSNPYSQSYNLGFDILHWNNSQGFKASINKSVTSSSSANSVMDIQLEYMYRMFVNSSFLDSNSFQVNYIAAYENYQNAKSTSDYKSSYNLLKLGVGASVPMFNSWSLDLAGLFGFGEGSSLEFLTRANYYYKQDTSLGIGFKARKLDYTLSGLKNNESFSETLTSFRYHY